MRTTRERRTALAELAPDTDRLPHEDEWTDRVDASAISSCDGCSQPRRLRRLPDTGRWLCCPCWDTATLSPEVSR
ncbi:MAG: hypothetical protein HOQ43_10770 [Glycomyces artemisiae]|uniref:Uncharacterized protein n=1 Tax=Glycomyces artemisiae TaxID=1076443 RepID=A0A850CB69_9ACTN|nr:hypothetical protein [Glycomyces artemisiae]